MITRNTTAPEEQMNIDPEVLFNKIYNAAIEGNQHALNQALEHGLNKINVCTTINNLVIAPATKLALEGKTEAVNFLITHSGDQSRSVTGYALSGYALAGRKEEVKKILDAHSNNPDFLKIALEGYICGGHQPVEFVKEQINDSVQSELRLSGNAELEETEASLRQKYLAVAVFSYMHCLDTDDNKDSFSFRRLEELLLGFKDDFKDDFKEDMINIIHRIALLGTDPKNISELVATMSLGINKEQALPVALYGYAKAGNIRSLEETIFYLAADANPEEAIKLFKILQNTMEKNIFSLFSNKNGDGSNNDNPLASSVGSYVHGFTYYSALKGLPVEKLLAIVLPTTSNEKRIMNLAIEGYATGNHCDQVIYNIKNKQASIAYAVLGYAKNHNINAATRLIADFNKPLCEVAHELAADDLSVSDMQLILKLDASKTEAIRAEAINGYQAKGLLQSAKALQEEAATLSNFEEKSLAHPTQDKNYFDTEEYKEKIKNQYKKQTSKQRWNFFYAMLALMFLTPFSLIITLPRLVKAKKNAPIQELVTTTEERKTVKNRHEKLRRLLPKVKDPEKPKKVLISKKGRKEIYLVDRAQLRRHRLFFAQSTSKAIDEKILLNKVNSLKEESKDIIAKLDLGPR